ncbi:glutaminyl-tRNA synthase (glutamine-hydrolyzing) subunit B [Candidatus Giovannonibacteria bacterium RIFCSPHIGHO2_02_FULL_46_20]|uniref:Aspartyl/glutamyl-tRNA(Asn/Gln) amidotransferase subunit B n=1 Tax=Candidatus Giovannonibacteria bacterium RIFCSPHIGHO2_02_FULL_46_20 TaxID=1798338 RepID=A0A1F5WGN6_9BACT|nr:MAG: glutaminyl-tRNA synthase (glutamine-hydrolyzing) subunit B [Candidatus Giovannonibacteria bacterium RIFCSPHIGHO2_02_FULL_46_20]
MKYQATIGLEIHAELRTKTKMFCNSKNDSDEKSPNTNICPVCTGHPGTLPVINEEAVRLVQRVGLALGGEAQKQSRFDRKNYFYPDLPKGYQISQYQHPLVLGGELRGIRITRVHLEEDTARSLHDATANSSLVDFNRSGVPLMELVTEPDITSAQQASSFAEELQLILQYLGASDANMEKGQMRCEANVSIRSNTKRMETGALGVKVEIKNLNSFRAVEQAIEYEIKRQSELLERGEDVVQETRGWDENRCTTFSQRSKESAHDYRYFPEPDLPPLEFSDEYINGLRVTIPELPEAKRKRLTEEYAIPEGLAETLVRERGLASFWERVVSELKEWIYEKAQEKEALKLAANYFTSDLLGLMKEKRIFAPELQVEPENYAELIKMIVEGGVSSRVAKDVLRHMVEYGGDPSTIVRDQGLGQVSDEGELAEVIKKVIMANPKPAEDYKAGKPQALQFLIGQIMKETKGAANPSVIREILISRYGSSSS